jgi:NDP-sugar pyrophosphorylase family protein
MKNNIKLIIPMSGIGKRFISEGYSIPKPLILVDGLPIIQHVVNLFPGINEIHFICNEIHIQNTDLVSILNSVTKNPIIHTVPNENRKGPVDAVLKIINKFNNNDEIIVSYCDYGTVWDFGKFLEFKEKTNLDGIIPCYTGFHPHMLGNDNYAYCKIDNNLVQQVKEKEPFTNNKMNEYASNGTYYFKKAEYIKKYFKKLIDLNININDEFYVSLVYNLLIEDGLNVGIYEIDKMLQWGTPYDLENYLWWANYFKKIKNQSLQIKNPKNTTLILPMAGKGSRFSEENFNLPKPLLLINDNPMVIESVKCLPSSDKNIFICLDEHINEFNIDNVLKNYFKNSEVIGISKTTEGQACTCEIGINEFNLNLETPIMISACDNGVFYNKEKYENLLNDENIDVIVWSFRNNQSSKLSPNSYAWMDVDNNDNIKFVSCKKFIYEDPLKTHAIIGTMFFRKGKYFIDGLNQNYKLNFRTNGEFYVDDVINRCIENGLTVKVFECDNYICWGTPNDYKTYNYWKEHFKL